MHPEQLTKEILLADYDYCNQLRFSYRDLIHKYALLYVTFIGAYLTYAKIMLSKKTMVEFGQTPGFMFLIGILFSILLSLCFYIGFRMYCRQRMLSVYAIRAQQIIRKRGSLKVQKHINYPLLAGLKVYQNLREGNYPGGFSFFIPHGISRGEFEVSLFLSLITIVPLILSYPFLQKLFMLSEFPYNNIIAKFIYLYILMLYIILLACTMENTFGHLYEANVKVKDGVMRHDIYLTPMNKSYFGNSFVILDGYGGLHTVSKTFPDLETSIVYNWDIARDLELLSSNSGLILDGFGGLHTVGNYVKPSSWKLPYFGWDIAKDIEFIGTNHLVMLDGLGGISSTLALKSIPPYFGWDIAVDMHVYCADQIIVLDGLGGIHCSNENNSFKTPIYMGWNIIKDFDVFNSKLGLILDGFGGVFSLGYTKRPEIAYFGWDIAKDIEMVQEGYVFVLDGFGSVHTSSSYMLYPAKKVPYFGWDIARDIEMIK